MKAEELMRFDWVHLVDDNTPRQIDWIRSGEIGLLWGKAATPPYLKPIPLTPEILEQNGFIYEPNSEEKDDGWWSWKAIGVSTGNEYVDIAFRGDNVAVYDLEIMKGFNSGTLHLDFIHQLQRSLRLFGIEKEIVL